MKPLIVLLLLAVYSFSIPCVEVVILGTGNPNPNGRAGASNLIRYGDTSNNCGTYQYVVDLGRGSLVQLSKLNRLVPENISAVFITHFHSDHTSDIFDYIQTNALDPIPHEQPPANFVIPAGGVTYEVENVVPVWIYDIQQRKNFIPFFNPSANITSFTPTNQTQEVYNNGVISVDAIYVEHAMNNSCALRFNTPAGAVVFSGDGRLGPPYNLPIISSGASVVVTNPFLDTTGLTDITVVPPFFPIMHMNSTQAGQMAAEINLPILTLTHLMPGPGDIRYSTYAPVFPFGPCTAQMWEDSVRRGGFQNKVYVAHDMLSIKLGLLQIAGFDVVDTGGNEIRSLQQGDTLDLADVPHGYQIRANTGAGASDIHYVAFSVNRNEISTEYHPPYTFRYNWHAGHSYTLSAVAYSSADGGVFGTPHYITFNVVDSGRRNARRGMDFGVSVAAFVPVSVLLVASLLLFF